MGVSPEETHAEAEMNSDNPSTPTAACAQDYDISSESSFTEESGDAALQEKDLSAVIKHTAYGRSQIPL